MTEQADGTDTPVAPTRRPTMDHAKIERLKKDIASGDYAIDPMRVAEKLIEQGVIGDVN